MPDQDGKQEEAQQRQLMERAAREAQRLPVIQSWPIDAEGNPMAIVTGACSDLVPTVQFGNTVIGPVCIMRPVTNGSLEDLINAARETQRGAEFVVGAERRLLQWAIDPASKIGSPVTGDAFAAPPPGYDPASMPSHPGDTPATAAVPAEPVAPATDHAGENGADKSVTVG